MPGEQHIAALQVKAEENAVMEQELRDAIVDRPDAVGGAAEEQKKRDKEREERVKKKAERMQELVRTTSIFTLVGQVQVMNNSRGPPQDSTPTAATSTAPSTGGGVWFGQDAFGGRSQASHAPGGSRGGRGGHGGGAQPWPASGAHTVLGPHNDDARVGSRGRGRGRHGGHRGGYRGGRGGGHSGGGIRRGNGYRGGQGGQAGGLQSFIQNGARLRQWTLTVSQSLLAVNEAQDELLRCLRELQEQLNATPANENPDEDMEDM